MKIYNCDKCGKTITVPKMPHYNSRHRLVLPTRMIEETKNTRTDVENPNVNADLCDKCVIALRKWLGFKKKNK